jgi:D-3-phosphoglycerate dehydrogenase
MLSFKAALVYLEAPEVPAWVIEQLTTQGIELVVHECKDSDELSRYAGDADVVWLFGGGHVVTAASIGVLRRCGAIIRTGSGTDTIPVEEATRLGIVVANTPGAVNNSVAEHAIALLLALGRRVVRTDRLVRSGIWEPRRNYPDWHLSGQTLGLIGFGNIGRCLVEKMSGFKLKILAYDPYVEPSDLLKHGVVAETLEGVLSQADFVSIHCPLKKETHHLIGERELRLMKPKALLINTSRGSLIDEPALVRALQEGWIAGAALDVLEVEPAPRDHPLFKLENVVLTPHIGGYSDRFWHDLWVLSVETLIDLAQGRWPRSYVNHGLRPRWALTDRKS